MDCYIILKSVFLPNAGLVNNINQQNNTNQQSTTIKLRWGKLSQISRGKSSQVCMYVCTRRKCVCVCTYTHTCDNLPREICDDLPQRNFFKFVTGLSSPCLRYWYFWPAHELGKKTLWDNIAVYCIENGA